MTPSRPQPDLPEEAAALPPWISQLSNREADQLLRQAEADRRAEIDAYWDLCVTDPVRAAQIAAGGPPILRNMSLLAGCRTTTAPAASSVVPLFAATARLLELRSVRDALLDAYPLPTRAEQVDRFWEDSLVVGIKLVGNVQVMVLRYGGAMFNPGTVPDTALTSDQDCFVVGHTEGDGNGNEVQFVTAYVIGTMDREGRWKPVALDLPGRGDLMRDLKAMETLVDRGGICGEHFETTPLGDFPATSDVLIAQLNAQKAALRRAGAMSLEWQAVVQARTARLYGRMEQLRGRMKRMEEGMDWLRCRAREVEACALEEETGFARGSKVRHKFTGEEGILDIVNFSCQAQFRLRGTTMYVTEDIRRGEWEPAPAPDARG